MKGATKLSALLAMTAGVDPALWAAMANLNGVTTSRNGVTTTSTGRHIPTKQQLHTRMTTEQEEWNKRVDARRAAKKARAI